MQVKTFGSEFAVLIDAPDSSIRGGAPPEIAEGILRVRAGRVSIDPGFDGEYGKIKIFEDGERQEAAKQTALF